jgi:hypothetical protein
MADESTEPREEPNAHVPEPGAFEPDGGVHVDVELRDRLPGGRAVIAVEQDGAVIWLADRRHVTPEAVSDFRKEMRRMAREGWQQNWPGAS